MPLGVFDSGLGGLTAVRELRRVLPGEDIVYFGDTGRVPYGTKGREVIISYARQDIAFLLSRDVKTLLAACGTVSSTFPAAEGDALPAPYLGVVGPTTEAAARATKNGRVGIIGTEATIASGSYKAALEPLCPGVETVGAACPLFVPLVENGHFAPGDPLVELTVVEYLAPLKAAGVDTLILGCTHYPLLAGAIGAYMGPDVTLIDSGRQAALALKARLEAQNLLNPRQSGGATAYYVSDAPERFSRLAAILLGDENPGAATQITIEKYDLRWIRKGYRPATD
ncbi:glutamate racemase [Ruminococcaceae bacterium OttesenSCG-928-D13]|nr:glutamate racemase [Ruminococcaceae bacterium OttesenSCG-928-D13]